MHLLLALKSISERNPPSVVPPATDENIQNPTASGSSSKPVKSEKIKTEKSEEKSDEILYSSPKRQLKSPFKKSPDSNFEDSKNTLRYSKYVELVPESNVFIDADKLKQCKNSSDNRSQLTVELMRAIFTDEILAKFLLRSLNNERATTAVLKFVTEINDEKWEKCEPLDVKHDPRQTLICPNLVKLIPTGKPVLVNEKELEICKKSAKGVRRTLARALMNAVFTKKALSYCSLCGQDALAFDRSDCDTRPGLDEHAVEVIMKFVESIENDENNTWDEWNKKSVRKALYSELEKRRL